MENTNFLDAAQSVHKLKHKISILGLEKVIILRNTKVIQKITRQTWL
jgi:hypothetical protein